jgi:hypothetical protein
MRKALCTQAPSIKNLTSKVCQSTIYLQSTTATSYQARSRAYRWGEDGLAGISDDQQRFHLALALWNGRDPILKERLFGLTDCESNLGLPF